MTSEFISNFSPLDELTQVIYQSVHRFIVLSAVSDCSWTVHVGLHGEGGRWWRGSWSQNDVFSILGSNPSDKMQETFAEGLAEAFVKGELYISNWNESGSKIKLTIGPTAKKPMHIALTEMSATDAAAYATNVFLDIAVHAQSRKCRLHPSTEIQYPSSAPDTTHASGSRVTAESNALTSHKHRVPTSKSSITQTSSTDMEPNEAREEIKQLKAQLKRAAAPTERSKSAAVPQARKGASLANPNKKARKYEAIEFGSDEE